MKESAFVDQIYEAPLANAPWTSFLDSFRRALGSYSAQLMFHLPCEMAAAVNIDVAEANFSVMSALYYQIHCQADPIQYEKIAVGEVRSLFEFVSRSAFRNSDYYRNFCAVHHVEDAISLHLGTFNGLRAWLNVSRGAERGHYSREEIALTRRLTPYLQRSLNVYSLLERARFQQELYSQMIDGIRVAVAFIGSDGSILSASGSAERILSSHPCMSITDGRIVLKNAREQRNFIELLRSVTDKSNPTSFVTRATCDCPTEKTTILLRRLTGTNRHRFATEPAVIMHIKEPFKETFNETRAISNLFHLSPAEARLALLLSTGSSVDEIATTLGITRHSVRTYCKRIFTKTGTKRQAELVGLVLDSVAVLVH